MNTEVADQTCYDSYHVRSETRLQHRLLHWMVSPNLDAAAAAAAAADVVVDYYFICRMRWENTPYIHTYIHTRGSQSTCWAPTKREE